MINPKGDVFRWGPIDSKIAYTAFSEFLSKVRNHLIVGWPDMFAYFKDNKVLFVSDYPSIRKKGLALFEDIILNEQKTKKYFDIWFESATQILKFQKEMEKLEDLGKEKLIDLFDRWYGNYANFWLYGSIPELANWGGEMLLKDKLLESNKNNFIKIFEALSSPEELSFYQTEELDLFELKKIKDEKLLQERLKEHQQKYYWLRNSYGHHEILPIKYFEDALSEITEEKAKEQIEKIKSLKESTKQKKKNIIEEYNIPKEIANISERLAYSIWWQDYRKKFIFMAIAEIEKFVIETSRRFGIDKEELYLYETKELGNLIKTGETSKNFLRRKNGFMEYTYEKKEMGNFFGEDANKIVAPFINNKIDENLSELSGLPVSMGKVKGKAKIILSPLKMTKMNFGDILVAPMTSPDFIVAMKKASAIITDEGGMTCHAAIVSRELGIPCVVATKNATKALKDNDLIEVNANHGIIKILERK